MERSIDDAEARLDHVRSLVDKGELDAGEFRQLVSAWQDVVATGRKAFCLDQQPQAPPHPMLLVQTLQTAVKVMPPGQEKLATEIATVCDSNCDRVGPGSE